MIALLLVGLGFAASGEVAVGGELLPDSVGETHARGSLAVAATEHAGAWSLALAGTLRGAPEAGGAAGLLERLTLGADWGVHRLDLGRFTRVDARGVERLDGVGWSAGGAVGGGAWLGRLWFPEDGGAGSETFLAGGHLRARLGTPVLGARLGAEAGGEMRMTGADLEPRLFGAVEARGTRGGGLRGAVEADPASGRLRADARAGLPVTRTLEVGATGRWEELPPPSVPHAAEPPAAWLAPEGYGVVAGRVGWRAGARSASVEAGPMLRPGSDPGGSARADAGIALGGARAAVFARGAWVGGAGFGGGGIGLGGAGGRITGGGEAGLYHLRALDGRAGLVGEVRARAGARVIGGEATGLRLDGELACGADRLLIPWVRGGLVLTARVADARPGEGG